MEKIFISYRSGDGAFAPVHLQQRIAERFGAENVFLDSVALPVGRDFRAQLWNRLATTSTLLVVIGPNWLMSDSTGGRLIDRPDDFVRQEVALALKTRMRVIPLLLDDTPMPPAHLLPDDIRDLTARQFRVLRARYAQQDIGNLLDDIGEPMPTAAPTGPTPAPTPPPEPARVGQQFLGQVYAPDGLFFGGDQIHGNGAAR